MLDSLIARADFPSFWEGLSLRPDFRHGNRRGNWHFPSFWEGLSLRPLPASWRQPGCAISLPFGLGRAFIEAGAYGRC